MPRPRVQLQSLFPHHLTARSNNKDWWYADIRDCWEIFRFEIRKVELKFQFQTHAFVLMNNHFHWIASTPEANLSAGMQQLMRAVSIQIGQRSGRINKIFGSRYKWTIIRNAYYYANAYRYVYQNPIRAGICNKTEDYPWSSVHSRSGICPQPSYLGQGIVPLEREPLLEWLNRVPDKDAIGLIRKAMRKYEFSLPRHPTRKTALKGNEPEFSL